MRIAWVTSKQVGHHVIGGAEMADADMISQAPEGWEVEVCRLRDLDQVMAADKVVITNVRDEVLESVAVVAQKPHVVWTHDIESFDIRTKILADSGTLVALSQKHLDFLSPHTTPRRSTLNPGWMDTSLVPEGGARDQEIALWAHRDIKHKGEKAAWTWAREKGIPLRVVKNRPREEALAAMREATYFLLLSDILDPAPRAVMEAQLSGCELVVNDQVGYYDESPDELRARLDGAGKHFWDLVGSA